MVKTNELIDAKMSIPLILPQFANVVRICNIYSDDISWCKENFISIIA